METNDSNSNQRGHFGENDVGLQNITSPMSIHSKQNSVSRSQDLRDMNTGYSLQSQNLSRDGLTRVTNLDANVSQEREIIMESKKVMSATYPPKNFNRIVALCIWAFTCGLSDAAPGALLPFIESHYNISYSIVSLIWMSNAAGYILIALISHKIEPWFGKRISLVVGCSHSVAMYALVSSGTLFPLIVVGFLLGGMGLAICYSQANIFMSRLENASTCLSFFYGSYGLGATVSPVFGTLMISSGIKWNYFYLIILGLMVSNTVILFYAFKGVDLDLKEFERDLIDQDGNSRNQDSGNNTNQNSQNFEIMKIASTDRNTWLLALFVLCYLGAEVALGGWIVTYLLDYRHGNPDKVGYVASGFWGGLTLGRLFLTRTMSENIGARRSNIILGIASILFVILVWVVPNAIAAAVMVSIAGITVGPCYPLQISLSTKLLPRKIQVVSLTIITGIGTSGGAIFPFIVGLISQKVGAFVVLPAFIALFSVMLILWILLPNVDRVQNSGKKMNLFARIW